MKTLYNVIEGAGHIKNRLGSGSSGVVYKTKNGVHKTFRLESSRNEIAREKKIIEKWSKIKTGLEVIPYITNVDWDGYDMEFFETPCPEGELIEKVMWKCLFSPDRKYWDESKINKAINLVGKDNAEWVMNWLDRYCHDYKLITNDKHISDDIRSVNIGKTKDGRIVCFDWFDPYN